AEAQDEQADSENGAAPAAPAAKAEPSRDALTPQKHGFLSAFFAPAGKRDPFPAEATSAAEPEPEKKEEAQKPEKPLIELASATPARAAMFSTDALPGVRPGEQLFDIRIGSGASDGDLDLYEQVDVGYQVASAAGLGRLAPNGLLKQRDSVDVSCLKPQLVSMLKTIERHFGRQ